VKEHEATIQNKTKHVRVKNVHFMMHTLCWVVKRPLWFPTAQTKVYQKSSIESYHWNWSDCV